VKRSSMLALATRTLLLLAVVSATALPVSGFAQSKLLSWKLNLAKSKFSPGPPPKSSTLTYLVEGQSLTATIEGVDAQGKPTKVVQGPYFYDGKSYPVMGAAAYDASSYKIVNNTTDEITRTKMGKVVQTVIEVLSDDGMTLTFTVTGANANGQPINNVAVYEKQ
jgi:hypothetical protein